MHDRELKHEPGALSNSETVSSPKIPLKLLARKSRGGKPYDVERNGKKTEVVAGT